MNNMILASASPRRAELLDQIGVRYKIHAVDIDESSREDESAKGLVVRLAKEKAEAVSLQINPLALPVLGSDTLGLVNGQLLVKPQDFDHAYEMLSQMSGQYHEILTAVSLCYEGKIHSALSINKVFFRKLTDSEIKQYWETGEPTDKAGAYAIQGLAATFIERIEGSYSGIMGLPLFETSQLLQKVGVSVLHNK